MLDGRGHGRLTQRVPIGPFPRVAGPCPLRWPLRASEREGVRGDVDGPPRVRPRIRGARVRQTAHRSVEKRGLGRRRHGHRRLARGGARTRVAGARVDDHDRGEHGHAHEHGRDRERVAIEALREGRKRWTERGAGARGLGIRCGGRVGTDRDEVEEPLDQARGHGAPRRSSTSLHSLPFTPTTNTASSKRRSVT